MQIRHDRVTHTRVFPRYDRLGEEAGRTELQDLVERRQKVRGKQSGVAVGHADRVEWQRRIDVLADALESGEIDDARWYAGMTEIFEAAYLAGENPRAQSGFGGDEPRWETARRPIAAAIDRDGSFLDIGCAGGYLLESLVRWTPHRIEPYGLELAPRLAALPRRGHPDWADRIYVGNALTWTPPRRFDFVRTELVYVPAPRERELLEHLLGDVLAPQGWLILCGYGSPRSGVEADPVAAKARSYGFQPELELEAEAPEGGGSIVELAVLRAD
jgi:hypothetical protein